MSKKFKYKALSNGTLSNPYRFVEKDQVVELDAPYDSKWLIPLDEANRRPVEQVMPNMNIVSAQSAHGSNGVEALRNRPSSDQNSTQQFKDNILAIQNREKLEDKAAKNTQTTSPNVGGVASVTPPAEAVADTIGGEAAQVGTGNQSVI